MKRLVSTFAVLAVLSVFLALPVDAKANGGVVGFGGAVAVDPCFGMPVTTFGFHSVGFAAINPCPVAFAPVAFASVAVVHSRAAVVVPARRTVIRSKTVIRSR